MESVTASGQPDKTPRRKSDPPRSISCGRCGIALRWTEEGSPQARLLRRARRPKGWCAGCALTGFLRSTEPLAMLLRDDPEKLLDERIQRQVAHVLLAGQADADPAELDWLGMVLNWNLPLTVGRARPEVSGG